MKTIFYPNKERGGGNHGWLTTRYSFSFNDWYDETKMGFGALRVLNDDVIAGGQGFGTHSHKDMEIITIVMQGAVHHTDSMGNEYVVNEGDVQVMSAGTGVRHAEHNNSATEPLELFQILIEPQERSITPRYDQKNFNFQSVKNNLTQVVGNESLTINQDATIYYGSLDAGSSYTYSISNNHGIYIFIIDGELTVNEQSLSTRDALGVWSTEEVPLLAAKNSSFLVIEIPME